MRERREGGKRRDGNEESQTPKRKRQRRNRTAIMLRNEGPKTLGRRPLTAPNWRPVFLTQLALTGNVQEACMVADVVRATAYEERQNNDQFARAWMDAKACFGDIIEREIFRRAVEGVPRRKMLGKKILEYREYSDPLLMFLAKKERPEFRDGPIDFKLTEEEAATWTPEMEDAYEAGMSVPQVRLLGKLLKDRREREPGANGPPPPATTVH